MRLFRWGRSEINMLPLESQRHCSRGAIKEIWTTVGIIKSTREGERDGWRDGPSEVFLTETYQKHKKSKGSWMYKEPGELSTIKIIAGSKNKSSEVWKCNVLLFECQMISCRSLCHDITKTTKPASKMQSFPHTQEETSKIPKETKTLFQKCALNFENKIRCIIANTERTDLKC